MKVNFVQCLQTKKGNRTKNFFNSARKIVKQITSNFTTSITSDALNTNSSNDYLHVQNLMHENGKSLSVANTTSETNLSNIYDPNPHLVKASSYAWPEVNISTDHCDGHECLDPSVNLNEKILFQPFIRLLKPKFTPPVFSRSGISTCPDLELDEMKSFDYRWLPESSVTPVEEETKYILPGNLEFQAFTNPKLGRIFRYTTFAVPGNKFEWERVYNHVYSIRNSFKRKYHCDVRLSSEPGMYKGQITFLVRIESENQENILRCRSGLPQILKDIILTPMNALNDVNVYITEYLIKRKSIFQKPISYRSYGDGMNVSNKRCTEVKQPRKDKTINEENNEQISNDKYKFNVENAVPESSKEIGDFPVDSKFEIEEIKYLDNLNTL